MMPFRTTLHETLKLLGFRNGPDLLASALGIQFYSWSAFKFYLAGASLATAAAFCTHWLWNPPSALVLLLFLDLANARYGWQVAKKLKHATWDWQEFQRTFGKLIATLIVLAVVRNLINAYDYYELLADGVFGWLFFTKTQKVVSKMVTLKVSEEGLPAVFMQALKWLLSTKLAPFLVDNAQTKPGTPLPTADPNAPTTPAATTPTAAE